MLSWDSSDLRKTIDKIEKAAGGPSKDHLTAIKKYTERSRAEHDSTRNSSMQSQDSVITITLRNANPSLLESLSPSQHSQCLEYYSALLAIRDREEITKALCRQNPDLFSQAIRELVKTFDYMIRTIHEKVDIREHISAAEIFITDFIETSKPKRTLVSISHKTTVDSTEAPDSTRAPSIEDYVSLLKRNRHLLYNWLHQVASQCPEIREDFREWAKDAVKVFRQNQRSPATSKSETPTVEIDTQRRGAAGALSSNLQALFTKLPDAARVRVLAALDAHAAYLTSLEALSLKRMQHILDDMPDGGILAVDDCESDTSKSSICGPGMFLSRWQHLLDETAIGPDVPNGPLRCGRDVKGSLAHGKAVSAAARDGWDPSALAKMAERDVPQPPAVDVVIEALGEEFRGLLMDLLNREQVDGQ